MKKRKVFFLLIVLLLFLCTCFLGACSKESAVMKPNNSTEPSNSTEPNSTAPENNSVEPDSGAADKNTLPSGSASPEPMSDANEAKIDSEEPLTWQSAYVEIICHMEDYLPLNLTYPDNKDYRKNSIYYNPNHKYGCVGIHDFDGDGVPELLAGDYKGMGIFTFADGKTEKIADLCWPDFYSWMYDHADFKDNSISLNCSGSTGSWVVCFGFVEGEYRLGRYYKHAVNAGVSGNLISEVTLNGEPSTPEEMKKIYNTNWSERDHETECRKWVEIINRDGTWVLKYWRSEEEFQLDKDFDFELVRW